MNLDTDPQLLIGGVPASDLAAEYQDSFVRVRC